MFVVQTAECIRRIPASQNVQALRLDLKLNTIDSNLVRSVAMSPFPTHHTSRQQHTTSLYVRAAAASTPLSPPPLRFAPIAVASGECHGWRRCGWRPESHVRPSGEQPPTPSAKNRWDSPRLWFAPPLPPPAPPAPSSRALASGIARLRTRSIEADAPGSGCSPAAARRLASGPREGGTAARPASGRRRYRRRRLDSPPPPIVPVIARVTHGALFLLLSDEC